MADLRNKVFDFKTHFNIKKKLEDDKIFKLDPSGNLITTWKNKDYYLTNRRNTDKFLSKTTMRNTLKYGVDFLREYDIIPPKKSKESEETKVIKPKPEAPSLKKQIEEFKKFHNIPEESKLPELKIIDDKLNVKRNDKWFPLYNRSKPLAKSTLQGKYGTKFLKDLSIPIEKKKNK